jgi:actin, other eukaryote
MRCDLNVRRRIATHVVLSGGHTMFPGLKERLEEELASLYPPSYGPDLKVLASKDRAHQAWTGGAILVQLPTFHQSMWIARREYDDTGPSVYKYHI